MNIKNLTVMSLLLGVAMVGCNEPTGPSAGSAEGILAGVDTMEHIYGPEISPDDLAGKVVHFVYWGRNCPPCRASFPHIVELQEEFGPTGKFTVLASHVQDTPAKAAEFCQSVNVNFPVYQQLRLPGESGDGYIPYMVLFDHEGNVVKRGRGSEFYELVPGLVEAAR